MKSFDILCECWPWCKMLQNTEHEKKDAKREKSDTKYLVIHFSFFKFYERFVLFHGKCIAGLTISLNFVATQM